MEVLTKARIPCFLIDDDVPFRSQCFRDATDRIESLNGKELWIPEGLHPFNLPNMVAE